MGNTPSRRSFLRTLTLAPVAAVGVLAQPLGTATTPALEFHPDAFRWFMDHNVETHRVGDRVEVRLPQRYYRFTTTDRKDIAWPRS